jgi:hypothetical protein
MPLPWNTSDRHNGKRRKEKEKILFVLNNELI